MPKFKDLTGNKFGRLTVIELRRVGLKNRTAWLCKCECGTEKTIRTSDLTSGRTLSCGCYQKEVASKANKKHDFYNKPIYKAWQNMKNRCLNPNIDMYVHYGARGIGVCDEWMDFRGFYKDMGGSHKEGLTLERIDVNGNYCKENCKWATAKEQANNKTSSRIYTVDGVTDTLKNICDMKGANYSRVRQRINYAGVSIEEALTIPPQPGIKLKTP